MPLFSTQKLQINEWFQFKGIVQGQEVLLTMQKNVSTASFLNLWRPYCDFSKGFNLSSVLFHFMNSNKKSSWEKKIVFPKLNREG